MCVCQVRQVYVLRISKQFFLRNGLNIDVKRFREMGKSFLRGEYVLCFASNRIRQDQRERERFSDWLTFFGQRMAAPLFGNPCCPAEARMIVIAKRKLEYLDVLTRI